MLFIHNDCFGASCRVLQISAIEMSALSRIQWNLIAVGLCQQNKCVETWLFKITIRACWEQSHISAIKLENKRKLPETSLGGRHYLLHPTMSQAWVSRWTVGRSCLEEKKKKSTPHENAHKYNKSYHVKQVFFSPFAWYLREGGVFSLLLLHDVDIFRL